jgi:nucleotide-binding universal stress UspA family protein
MSARDMSAHPDARTQPGFPLRQVLVITDLAPASTNAVWRAALIARERGASLRVLHASSRDRGSSAAARDALGRIAGQVHGRLGIEPEVEAHEGELLPKAISAAREAGLLVIGSRRANALRDWISGTQAERLIRLCRIPTLVVKRPAAPGRTAAFANTLEPGSYERVLVSVDLRPDAVDLIAAAMTLSRGPHMEVFHALAANSKLTAIGPRPSETAMQRAQAMLRELVQTTEAHQLGAVASIAFGHAASSVLARERASGSELIVIGKRQRGLMAGFLLGGLTRQVLAGSRSDVLVMPGI